MTSRYQLHFPRGLVDDFGRFPSRSARVLVPLTTRDKRMLLRFRVLGPRVFLRTASHASPVPRSRPSTRGGPR